VSERERQRELLAFYAEVSAPEATVHRLVALAEADGWSGAKVAKPRTRRWRWALATAAVVGALASVPAYELGRRAGRAETADCQPIVVTEPQAPGLASVPPAAAPAPMPRLLLMEVRADWCPRTPVVIPIFQELSERYRNEPVLFVSFDITTEGTRRQAAYLAASLGLSDILGRRWEPGLLQLVDREQGVIVESLRETFERPRFERALTDALPSPPS